MIVSGGRQIRVLVVDDNVVVRTLVSRTLAEDPDLEVVGTAANGRIALSKVEQLGPDVVTLDLEMPEMDGLEVLRQLRPRHSTLPVIVFSTLTTRGAAATLDALSLGANDYVPKPSNFGSVTVSMERVREDLIAKIKTFCAPVLGGRAERPLPPAIARRPPRTARPAAPSRVDVVGIAVSTGGPAALAELLPALPASLPVPVVIVQHMPPLFTGHLADRLDTKCAIGVAEAQDGAPLEPGHAWIAPGGRHLVVERGGALGAAAVASLNDEPPVNSCRPSADPMLFSLAHCYGPHVLAVVLTGMGHDGLDGAAAVADAGGQVVAQDEASSVVWGMPGYVAGAGIADAVVPLDRMATEIVARLQTGRARQGFAGASAREGA